MTRLLYKVILGPSGSGKTTLINNKIKENSSFAIKTATTGRAALIGSEVLGENNENISGTTINSLLGYSTDIQLAKKVTNKSIYRRLKAISQRYQNIIIDEISMASALTINYLYLALNTFNSDGRNPYLGLILTGDFAQLPHVTRGRVKTKPAFESMYWDKFSIAKLKKVRRQNNKEFIRVLQHIRKGNSEDVIDWIDDNIGFNNEIDSNFEGTTIFTKNIDVNEFNKKKLLEIDSFSKDYEIRYGGMRPPLELIGGRIQEVLTLKEGALIITLVNNIKEGYANGSLGIVRRLKPKSVEVEIISTRKIVDIGYYRIDNKNILTDKSEGYISFIPIRLAYASTVHSIQGTSIDGGIQFKVKGDSFLRRLSGGLYVIVSRVRDYKKMRIIGSKEDFMKANYLDKRYSLWI